MNEKILRIVFDAYKIKAPNTGLHHFNKELTEALLAECNKDSNLSISFFAKKRSHKYLNKDAKRLTARDLHCIFLKAPKGTVVWHIPYQFAKHIPFSNKVKKILTIHDLNFLYEETLKKDRKGIKQLQRRVNRANHIVAISSYVKQEILKHINTKNKPVDVIYNGCNIYRGKITPPHEVPSKPFLFGIGAILPKKNWHTLPPLLQDNDYVLYIAGGATIYSNRIMKAAEEWGVSDRVRLLGEISEAEKHWYLSNCEAFFFPSICEGFGLPVLEAMYFGKPTFISRYTSLPEVGGEVAYYFNYDFDPEQMQREFRQGMEHFQREGDPEAIKRHALSFSWENAAREYIDLYKRMATL